MKRILYLMSIALVLAGVVKGCDEIEEPPVRGFPGVNTLAVSNITKDGATFNAELIIREGYEILQYGFLWSDDGDLYLDASADREVFSKPMTSNSFSAEIKSTLKENTVYQVKAFVKTADYTIYGKIVEFESIGSHSPLIMSVMPLSGEWGDTVKIKGKNFSFSREKNTVHFGETKVFVLEASDSLLSVIVPAENNREPVEIKVAVAGRSTTYKELFSYLLPTITAVSPLSGTFGDTVTIRGNYFFAGQENNKVTLGSVDTKVIFATSTEIKFIVPDELLYKESGINLRNNHLVLNSNFSFTLNPPVITSFDPETVTTPQEVITLYGENFHPLKERNQVLIEGYEAEITEATKDYLKVRLPDQVIPSYQVSEFKKVGLQVSVVQQYSRAEKDLTIDLQSSWTQKKSFPGLARDGAVAFSLNGKGYYGTGNQWGNPSLQDFWEYNPETDLWTRLADFPGVGRSGAVSFIIDGKAYVGLGVEEPDFYNPEVPRIYFQDFYRFDPANRSWEKIADFEGIATERGTGFVVNGEAFIGTGSRELEKPLIGFVDYSNFWKYNPLLNSWTEVKSFPRETSGAVGFTETNEGYVFDKNALFKWSGSDWVKQAEIGTAPHNKVAFTINHIAYIGFGPLYEGRDTDFWEYDPSTGIMTNRPVDYGLGLSVGSAFVIGEKAFIIQDNRVWEFDPSISAF